MLVPVYDILNCGPNKRFVANGKLVHNSESVNLQNLPSRDINKRALKQSIKAPPGYVVISSDSSQIECRSNALFCGETSLLNIFQRGGDPYSEFASIAYGRAISKADKEERFVGKTCQLGLGYMTGAEKLHSTLRLAGVNTTLEFCRELVSTYRGTYSNIKGMWGHLTEVIHCMVSDRAIEVDPDGVVSVDGPRIILPNGLHLNYPGLKRERGEKGDQYVYWSTRHRKWNYLYSGKLLENIIQALARIVITDQMTQISAHYKVVMQVHDEIVTVTKRDDSDTAVRRITDIMSTPPSWWRSLPVACEVGVGLNYGDA